MSKKNELNKEDVAQGNMSVEFNDDILGETSILKEEVETDTEMKEWMVNYVGTKHAPEDASVTVEMIVETMAEEFPEFLMAIAEENWVRGYHQALSDVSVGEEMARQEQSEKESDE
jgi:hypothetical protein